MVSPLAGVCAKAGSVASRQIVAAHTAIRDGREEFGFKERLLAVGSIRIKNYETYRLLQYILVGCQRDGYRVLEEADGASRDSYAQP